MNTRVASAVLAAGESQRLASEATRPAPRRTVGTPGGQVRVPIAR